MHHLHCDTQPDSVIPHPTPFRLFSPNNVIINLDMYNLFIPIISAPGYRFIISATRYIPSYTIDVMCNELTKFIRQH